MPVTFQTACRLFEQANQLFLTEARHAVVNNVSERNWYGTMKSCLDRVIVGTDAAAYHSDIEYNRNGGELKTIMDEQAQIQHLLRCDPAQPGRDSGAG